MDNTPLWLIAGFGLGLLLPLLLQWRKHAVSLRSSLLLIAAAGLLVLLGRALSGPDQQEAGTVIGHLARLLLGFGLIRLAGLSLFREVLPVFGIRPARIVEDLLVVLGYVLWSFSHLHLIGLDPTSIITTSAALTAIVAFAMQDTLGNVMGGLLIEMGESMHLGDWVRIGDHAGRIEQIRWRDTSLRTRDGELVVVPNSSIMRGTYVVLGNPDMAPVRVRRTLGFSVARSRPPAEIVAIAEGAVTGGEIANVAHDRAASCVLMETGPAHFRFALRYWLTDPGQDDPTDSVVRMNLHTALRRADVALAAPQQTVFASIDSPERTRALAEVDLAARCETLRQVSIFATLSEEERLTLAARLKPAPFASGEVITHQGATAHWLYVIERGEAAVFVATEEGERRRVATIAAGGFFGEMSLLTGAPRRATVVAATDMECFRLDKESFEGVLHARPALAAQLSQILLEREEGLRQTLAQSPNGKPVAGETRESLMSRILTFFGVAPGVQV
jgi:small-conductance mechanosensitive channel/CRP-like cAMP-binding protein